MKDTELIAQVSLVVFGDLVNLAWQLEILFPIKFVLKRQKKIWKKETLS
jgi:hypothetical protein